MKRKPRLVSADNKKLARFVADAFGGIPHVDEFAHDSEDLTVGILWCKDRPCPGVSSYSTVRLSDYPMLMNRKEFPVRVEIVGACASERTHFPNILASAAFCVMRTKKLIEPGSVLDDYVGEYYPTASVPHLFLTSPFLWEPKLQTLRLPTKTVAWLLGVPISEAERQFLSKHGDSALEDLFEKRQIDVFDLERESVL